jgi:hypothetical protein
MARKSVVNDSDQRPANSERRHEGRHLKEMPAFVFHLFAARRSLLAV